MEPENNEIQTRTERSRSLDDADKYRAIETLTDLGLFEPLTNLDLFHGRVVKEGEDKWKVDPKFNNAGNATGNRNINKRPTLYASDQDVASEFAQIRAHDETTFRYRQYFENIVRNYTLEQKKEWLNRVNSTPGANRTFTIDSVDLPGWIHTEAKRIEKNYTDEHKKEVWDSALNSVETEIQEIVSSDSDAMVIDSDLDMSQLTDEQKQKYITALQALLIPITEGSPLGFNERDKPMELFLKSVETYQGNFIPKDAIADLAKASELDENTTLHLASAYNTRIAILNRPLYLSRLLLDNSHNIITKDFKVEDDELEVPLNMEYAERFMQNAHIVGVKIQVNSATLGGLIDSVSFFDLHKIGTDEQFTKDREETSSRLGTLAFIGERILPDIPESGNSRELLALLSDAHAKPHQLIEAAKGIEGYKKIFESDSGVWEHFTLAEHTETVLRNLDENFSDNIPVDLLPLLRLAILAHDTGKPRAYEVGEKYKQKEFNSIQSEDFFFKLGIDDSAKNLLKSVFGDGADLVFNLQKNPMDEVSRNRLKVLAQNALSPYYENGIVSDIDLEAFGELCKIFQLCDGGAYTSMGITRGKMRYRNAPSFNNSFAQPMGVGKRDIRYAQREDETASKDLTPKTS